MGAFVGRYANRIGGAKFTLDGQEYQLAKNNGENSLHGGQKGSRFCVYDAHQINESSVEMFYTYKDGEENYPGTLATRVYYEVTEDNALVVDYQAYAVDKNTVANFTTHSFFNLSGNLGSEILDHVIYVNASRFLPIDKSLIPTGELESVHNTPMDFQKPTPSARASRATTNSSSSPTVMTITGCSTSIHPMSSPWRRRRGSPSPAAS